MQTTIITTELEFNYDEYLDYCYINEKTPQDAQSEDFFQYQIDESKFNFECDKEQIQASKYNDNYFVVTGECGLWYGNREIVPIKTYGLWNAIEKCIGNGIIDIVATLDTEENCINVDAKHHDGTNSFAIHMLTDAGKTFLEDELEKYNNGAIERVELNDNWFAPILLHEIF